MGEDFRLNGVKSRQKPYINAATPVHRGQAASGRINRPGGRAMFRLVRILVVLGILGLVGLSAYAYLGLEPPQPQDMKVPVTLDVG